MADYGSRVDGVAKGKGYFGALKRPDGKISDIVDKAVEFARARKQAGLPAFAQPDEEGLFKVPEE